MHVACRDALADGHSLMLHCGTFLTEKRTEFVPPLLRGVPPLGRLFRSSKVAREPSSVLLVVTPQVVVSKK